VVIASLVSDVFLTPRNLTVILKQAAPLGILAVGETIVLLTGGIDLSVASVMATASIFAAGISNGSDEHIWPVILLCLTFSVLVGFGNGLLVTKLKIPPFIATLGMILVVQGIRFVYSKGTPKSLLGPGFQRAGSQCRDHLGRGRGRGGVRPLAHDLRPAVVRRGGQPPCCLPLGSDRG
jgi:ribose transport system permease protein/inositol transport system permease protein